MMFGRPGGVGQASSALATLLMLAAASATTLECPPPGSEPLVVDLGAIASGDSTVTLALSTAAPSSSGNGGATTTSDFVCLLSLLVPAAAGANSAPAVRKPVARTYAGREWEVKAGPFAESVAAPVCDGGGDVCALEVPVDAATLGAGGENQYILTSYSHGADARTEAARFLEQATFGATLTEIDALSATSNSSSFSPDFANWLEHQMNPSRADGGAGMSAHREFFRKHVNPRFEYPFRGGAQAKTTACDVTSRWRKFAFTERDGVVSLLTYQDKMLNIKYENGRYVWYVEGMARTTTATLGKVKDVDGDNIRSLQVSPVAYELNCGKYKNDNHKYSCVDCPVRICRSSDGSCGYIDNPLLDLTGIEGTSKAPYTVVDLPDHNSGDSKMVGIDDGPHMVVLEEWQKPGDEFWLNDTTVDAAQCDDHPSPQQPQASQFDYAYHGLGASQHMESAMPTVFGRSTDAQTGQVVTFAFDPIFAFHDNTVGSPIPDGGGSTHKATDGWFKGLGWEFRGKFDEPVQDGAVHCANAQRTFLNEDGCRLSFDPDACRFDETGETVYGNGQGVVVCGSPGEVSNDFTNGVIDGFSIKSWAERPARREIYKDGTFTEQKHNVWTKLALTARDQLRQRVAWALYQIVPIGSSGGFVPYTEVWTDYYDIFVRHAFGNYRDVLKEISFNVLMADWLSFRNNAAVQHALDGGAEIYPDENYAREVMQLFSVGLFQLNMNGSKKVDGDGNLLYTYDSDDIMSYARAWTGFERQNYFRGNVEMDFRDPMTINREKRDLYPKTDLQGGYIGDGYPLCADLPDRDFLRKGATYLALGSRSSPEQQHDPDSWEGDSNILRLGLDPSSPLYAKLCAPDAGGTCTFPTKVVLDENLAYDSTAAHALDEYNVDTLRTVQVQSGSAPVYYEYLRPPCVNQNFFNDGRKVVAGTIGGDAVVHDAMCADPRVSHASEACCTAGATGDAGRFCAYSGERMKFDSAVDRCLVNGQEQCDPSGWASSGACADTTTYSWSTAACSVRAKFSLETGQVARVDYPGPDSTGIVRTSSGTIPSITSRSPG